MKNRKNLNIIFIPIIALFATMAIIFTFQDSGMKWKYFWSIEYLRAISFFINFLLIFVLLIFIINRIFTHYGSNLNITDLNPLVNELGGKLIENYFIEASINQFPYVCIYLDNQLFYRMVFKYSSSIGIKITKKDFFSNLSDKIAKMEILKIKDDDLNKKFRVKILNQESKEFFLEKKGFMEMIAKFFIFNVRSISLVPGDGYIALDVQIYNYKKGELANMAKHLADFAKFLELNFIKPEIRKTA